MVNAIVVDAPAVTSSTGPAAQQQAANNGDLTTAPDSASGDPEVAASLAGLHRGLSGNLDNSQRHLSQADQAAQNFSALDAATSGGVSSINAGNTALSTGGGLASAMPVAASMAPAMMSAGMQMATLPMTMAATMATPMSSGMVALTPTQQMMLAQSLSSSPGTATATPAAAVTGGNGQLSTLASALVQAHIPYAWGGGSLDGPTRGTSDGGGAADANGDYNKTGFDCSGLSRYVTYRDTGVELPRTSEAQYAATAPRAGAPQPGDLVFPRGSFSGGGPGHVQVYLGNGQVLEAPQSGEYVRVSAMDSDAIVHAPK